MLLLVIYEEFIQNILYENIVRMKIVDEEGTVNKYGITK
jgi:hypothetical protein